MRPPLRSFIILLFILLCMGCAKPNIKLDVASQPNVNPDHSGRPSPVILKMYELKSDLTFRQSDFIALFENPMQVLGADLVAADEIVFVPGEARTIEYSPNAESRFVGILLGFRQMERAHWRAIRPVDPESKNRICIELNDTSVLLIDENAADNWDAIQTVQNFQKRLQPVPQPTETPHTDSAQLPQSPRTTGYVVPSAQRM